jgi:hypothetical protein
VALDRATWYRLFGWLAIGLVVYFLYSRRRSRAAFLQPAE